MKLEGAA
jgi:tRNA G18 (ribose-2'-O)-methylase SpoU